MPEGEDRPEEKDSTAGDPARESAKATEDASDKSPEGSEDGRRTTDDVDADARVHVNSTFNGTVIVGDGGAVGFSVSERVQRDSGAIADSVVAATRRLYSEPADFARASAALRRDRLLISVGGEGTGRAAGSLMLADARRDPGATIYRLPPTRTLAELSKQTYKSGHCYLVHDWIRPAGSQASLDRFDADQLATRLKASDAYLILTTTRASQHGSGSSAYETRWTPPDLEDVFDHCFKLATITAEAEDAREMLRGRAAALGSARQVVRLVEGLADGVEFALSEVEDSDREAIAAWFDANPNHRAVRAATVLAFAGRTGDDGERGVGVGQRTFEVLFARLEAAQAMFRGDRPPEEMPAPPEHEAKRQDRHSLFADSGLADFVTPPTERAAVGAQLYPGFRTRRQRDLFMELLHLKYGHDHWGPMRIWFDGIVSEPAVSDAQVAVAYGLGRFTRHAFDEVRTHYLEEWAAGAWPQRTCAVFALWSMVEVDDLAPLALNQATSWVRNRGQERAVTAAIAFGGALGKRYPSEAMRRLWPLALRGKAISGYALFAIANLLAIESADEADSGGVSRYLANKIRPLLLPGAIAADRRAALWVIVGILNLDGRSPGLPLAAQVLRERPDVVEALGELWAGTLRSAPHRGESVESLHRTLLALVDFPGAAQLARRLGQAILPHLSTAQRRQVELGLRGVSTLKDRRDTRMVLQAFLDAAPDPDAGSGIGGLTKI
jgi:hypothetical protein